ncbi:unnamed protein product [Brassica rapa]|uniref:Uncharacterized protein n=1 Tax=Brassica campestris TaxID=3711 RepID=A0A8D9MAK3_BRACM|nr:unnamed protein product [Brassica rapa]
MKEVICFSEIGAKSTQIYKRFEEDLHFVKLLHVYIRREVAVHISNAANLVLFVANFYASVESR